MGELHRCARRVDRGAPQTAWRGKGCEWLRIDGAPPFHADHAWRSLNTSIVSHKLWMHVHVLIV